MKTLKTILNLKVYKTYQLLTIHPFWDGNGRTARALATYILKSNNYDLKGFYSMEEFYDRDIEKYYDSLQMRLNHNYYFGRDDADLTQWITYSLEIMVDVFEKVSRTVKALYNEQKSGTNMMEGLDKRQRWIADYIIQNGSIKATVVSEHFKIDEKTARTWLKNWIAEGFVRKKDDERVRNVEYVLANKYLTNQ